MTRMITFVDSEISRRHQINLCATGSMASGASAVDLLPAINRLHDSWTSSTSREDCNGTSSSICHGVFQRRPWTSRTQGAWCSMLSLNKTYGIVQHNCSQSVFQSLCHTSRVMTLFTELNSLRFSSDLRWIIHWFVRTYDGFSCRICPLDKTMPLMVQLTLMKNLRELTFTSGNRCCCTLLISSCGWSLVLCCWIQADITAMSRAVLSVQLVLASQTSRDTSPRSRSSVNFSSPQPDGNFSYFSYFALANRSNKLIAMMWLCDSADCSWWCKLAKLRTDSAADDWSCSCWINFVSCVPVCLRLHGLDP